MKMVLLEDCCEILDSMRVPITAADREEGPYPYYGANGVQDHVASYLFDDELVLLAEDGGNFGSKERPIAYRVSGKCWVNNHAHVLKPRAGMDVDYLCYSLMFYNTDGLVNGATRQKLTQATMRKMLIPERSIEEQKRIVDQLNRVVALRSGRQQQLQALDKLIKARFVEMFGEHGRQVPLSDFVWFQEGPGVRSVDFTNEGVILLTGSNINDNEITFGHKSDRFISRALADGRYAHFMCDIDDILVVSSAIDPEKFDKKVTIVREDKKYCLNTGIIRFKPDRKVMTLSYFREFLKTDYFKHQVMEEMRGIAQMHFGPSHLKKMTILLPDSLEQQRLFEDFVSQVDKSKVVIQKALDKAQLLFDSLMQKYFG